MLQRLKNLWLWSAISPYEAGLQAGQAIAQALAPVERGEIVYPNRVKEVLEANPEATLDELITR